MKIIKKKNGFYRKAYFFEKGQFIIGGVVAFYLGLFGYVIYCCCC